MMIAKIETGSETPLAPHYSLLQLRDAILARPLERILGAHAFHRRTDGRRTLDDTEDFFEIGLDLVLVTLLGQRELLDQQRTRGIQHFALAKGQILISLEEIQISKYFGDLENRAGLDLLHVFTIATVQGGGVDRNILLAENRVDLL